MTHAGSWTPAPRGGLIPLHPIGFGTVLGKSFGALRGNPKVLLGFAIGLQLAAVVLMTVAIGAVAFWSFSRLDSLEYGTQAYNEVEAGSTLITGLGTLVLSILVAAISVLVQAVVVGDVAHSALGEKATLGRIWARVKGRFWPLIGYTLVIGATMVAFIVVDVAVVAGLTIAGIGIGFTVALAILGFLGTVALYFFLYTKLYAVTPAIVLERAGVFRAIGRSWRLTRGRFWPTFGVYALLSLILGTASSIVTIPFTLLGSILGFVFAPTGDPLAQTGVAIIVTYGLSMIVAFLVQCVTAVVLATSQALVYLDLRMRREGLDMKLQRYVEARDAGSAVLTDPYAYDPNDVAPERPTYGYPPAPGYPTAAPGYPPAPGYGYPPAPAPSAPAYGYPPTGAPAQGAWQQPAPWHAPPPQASPGAQPRYTPPGAPAAPPQPGAAPPPAADDPAARRDDSEKPET